MPTPVNKWAIQVGQWITFDPVNFSNLFLVITRNNKEHIPGKCYLINGCKSFLYNPQFHSLDYVNLMYNTIPYECTVEEVSRIYSKQQIITIYQKLRSF